MILKVLNFPSYSFSLIIFVCLLIGGLIGSTLCFGKWLKRHHTDDDFKLFAASFGLLLISLLGGFGFYAIFVDTYKFRNIDFSKVSEFEIVESKSEYSPNGQRIEKFQDAKIIREMLESLQKCESFTPNHESFQDGYKIKLIFEDGISNEDFFISVYKRSNTNSGRTSLMPHVSDNRGVNLGNYKCNTFEDLVSKNIDPLFQNK